MKILVLLAHPKPESFNHVIKDAVIAALQQQGHTLTVHDLYQEHFDPVLPADEDRLPEEQLPQFLRDYIRELKEADGLIFIHPNWWGGPPAILRGWIERVVRTNSCYNFTKDGVVSYIGNKTVQIFSTSNTPHDIEMSTYGDPLEKYWKVIVFGLLGCPDFERRNFTSVVLSTPDERQGWLAEIAPILQRRFA